MGENVSKRLVRGIAKAGRGVAEFMATGERMQSKVSGRSIYDAQKPSRSTFI